MQEISYHPIADATLEHCFDRLDEAYLNEQLKELELDGSTLTLVTATGKTFLVSKHSLSLQLWLASPLSGGLHFRFNESEQSWILPDGRKFYDILRDELAQEKIEVVL